MRITMTQTKSRVAVLAFGILFRLTLTAQTTAWETSGDSCMQAFNLFQALNCYSQALKQEDTQGLRMKIAECHYRRGNYRACIGTLQPLAAPQLSHNALRQLFYSYKALGITEKFKQTGRTILNYYPMDAEVLADLCHEYNLEMNPFDTFHAVDEYLAKDSTNLAVNRVIAEAEFLLKEFQGAKYSYEKLLAAGDSSYITYFSAGVCAEQLSRYDSVPFEDKVVLQVEAVDYLKRAVAVSDSAQAAPFYHLGNLYNEMKNYQESEKCFKKAIQLLTPDPVALNICWGGLAESLYSTAQFERAARAFETSLSFHQNSITSLYYLSICYEGYGDYAKAKAQFENFLNKASSIGNPSEYLKQMITDARQRLSKLK